MPALLLYARTNSLIIMPLKKAMPFRYQETSCSSNSPNTRHGLREKAGRIWVFLVRRRKARGCLKPVFESLENCFRVEENNLFSMPMVTRLGRLGYKLPKKPQPVSNW